jgi:AmmeMemoRadiSam system protein B/AmmeMemoRadiSam system protein A
MKRIILVFAFLSVFWNSPEQLSCQTTAKDKINRVPAVAGSFYPSNPQELRKMVEDFFSKAKKVPDCSPLALVVPHAGYVFSGEVAASGYMQLDPERTYKHIFIIGPTHRVYFDGINIYTRGDFEMPFGIVPVDPLAGELAAANNINTDPSIQKQEHSIEVQLPFLQVRLKKPFSIVPILIGGESPETARRLAKLLEPYFNSDNLFIISSDFSHYPTYSVAMKADKQTADAIVSNSANKFLKAMDKNKAEFGQELATSICGWMPVLTLLMITEKKQNFEFRKIIYKNSGDTSYGDRDKVVGYWAIAVSEKKTSGNASDFQLPEKDKIRLLKIARSAIRTYLQTSSMEEQDIASMPGNLLSKSGAFVTLTKNKELRGCIGRFVSDQALYRTVQEMAIAAATQDSRFSQVNLPELDKIEIEISVLTPLKRIASIAEFKLGRDGIYMKKGARSGTFLPQVAAETGWNTEEFLGHCAQDKALIGWDGWKDKDTELYSYQALVFSEAELMPELSKKQK